MFKVGAIVGNMKLNLKGWNSSTKKVKQDQDKLKKASKATSAVVSKLGGVLAGLGIGLGLKNMIAQSITAMDSIQKLSLRLGESTEFLSEMQFVAERSGVTIESFQMSVQRANRRLADFAVTGKGEAADAIEQLGLKVKDAAGNTRSFEDLLPEIADGFNKLSGDSEKTRLAFKLFGREGISFIQMLKEGSTGIEALRKRSRELGVSITQDMADKAAHAADMQADLKFAVTGLSRELTITFLPAINAAAVGLTTFFVDTRKAWQETIKLMTALTMKEKFELFKDFIINTGKELLKGTTMQNAMMKGMVGTALDNSKMILNALDELESKTDSTIKKINENSANVTFIPDGLEIQGRVGRLQEIVNESQNKQLKSWNNFLQDQGLSTKEFYIDLTEWMAGLSEGTRTVLEENYRDYLENIQAIDDANKSKIESTTNYMYDKLSLFNSSMISNIKSTEYRWKEFGNVIENVFSDLFHSILSDFLSMMSKMIAKQIAFKLLSGTLTGGGSIIAGPILNSIPRAANGATFDRPTLAIVGDSMSGPERVLNGSETKAYNNFISDSHNRSINDTSILNSNNDIDKKNVVIYSTIPGIEFYEKNVKTEEYKKTKTVF